MECIGIRKRSQVNQLSMICSYYVIDDNTKDGFAMNHNNFNSLTITDSISEVNTGRQWKWAENDNSTTTFVNNLMVGICAPMSQSTTGSPSTFNTYLSDL
jgi:hypothetical protein